MCGGAGQESVLWYFVSRAPRQFDGGIREKGRGCEVGGSTTSALVGAEQGGLEEREQRGHLREWV